MARKKASKSSKRSSPAAAKPAMTKSDFIRAHPSKSAAEVVVEATKSGLHITPAMVYTIRGRPIPTRGRGRPRKNPGAAPVKSSSARTAPASTARTAPAKERLALLALEVGLDRAEQVLAQLRRALG